MSRSVSFFRDYGWLVCALVFMAAHGIVYAMEWALFVNESDFAIMAEVARRVAHGATLYVDAIDQKGPMLYLWWAAMWHLCHSYHAFFGVVCLCEWLFASVTTLLACRIFHEEGRDDVGIIASVVMFFGIVAFVGKVENYAMPFVMWELLVVRRVVRGRDVRLLAYGVVGVGIGLMALMKWPVCVMFFVVLAYGLGTRRWREMLRGVLLAVGVASLTIVVCLLASLRFTTLDAMWRQYLCASGVSYALGLSILDWHGISGVWLAGMVVFAILFFVGSVFVFFRLSRRVLWVVACLVSLPLFALCCAIVYYMAFALPVTLASFAEFASESRFRVRRRHARRVSWTVCVPVAVSGMVCVVLVMAYFVESIPCWVSYPSFADRCLEVVGGGDSVACDGFDGVDTMSRMGLVAPYAQPGANNVRGDGDVVWSDLRAGRWQYMISGSDLGNLAVGDTVDAFGRSWTVVATSGMGSGCLCECDEPSEDLMHCDRYVAF